MHYLAPNRYSISTCGMNDDMESPLRALVLEDKIYRISALTGFHYFHFIYSMELDLRRNHSIVVYRNPQLCCRFQRV